MPFQDTKGATWAHKLTVKEGDRLMTDAGFTCMSINETKTVKAHPDKVGFESLYIECSDGKHFLDGQLGDDDELIGLYPVN